MKHVLSFILILVALSTLSTGVMAQDEDTPATVALGGNEELGEFLVGADGMTIYIFTNDTPGVSNCYDQCAANWPPLTVEEDVIPTLAEGVPGRLGVISRDDGTSQVVYNGYPLYYWAQDTVAGEATGQGAGDVWFVATVPDVSLGGNEELGSFLVGANGMTLYKFTNDAEGVSNCYDQCATNWPPLLDEDGEGNLFTQLGLVGEFGTTERTDGTHQITYNGAPLYYWAQDTAHGEATGQGAGDVWYVVKPNTLNLGSSDDLGEFLIGPDGMTLYLFTNDAEGVSNCYDQCAGNWPPLMVAEGEEITVAEGISGELGTIERTDGGLQVTYNGIPLYYWLQDVVPGDTTGEGVGDVWYIVNP